jgi:prepilin-type N-terminal cleavage/methylation domain-containing protein
MKHKQRGYTLLELMIVVILIGIVTSVAAPQMSIGMANNSVSNATNETVVAFRYARANAARFGRAMGIFVEANGTDSFVRVDRSGDNTCDALPTTCNANIPDYGGADCGLRVVLFSRGSYPRHRVQLAGMNGVAAQPSQLCVTPRGRLMERVVGGGWARTARQVEIGVHRVDASDTSVGVVRAVVVGTSGLPRVALSRADLF